MPTAAGLRLRQRHPRRESRDDVQVVRGSAGGVRRELLGNPHFRAGPHVGGRPVQGRPDPGNPYWAESRSGAQSIPLL
jgi:hypothetical protein